MCFGGPQNTNSIMIMSAFPNFLPNSSGEFIAVLIGPSNEAVEKSVFEADDPLGERIFGA
jgi:hypothetical protein